MGAHFAGFPGYPAVLLTHEALTNVFITLYLSIFSPGKPGCYVFHSFFLKYPVPLLYLRKPPRAARPGQAPSAFPDQPGPASPPLVPTCRRHFLGLWRSSLHPALWLLMHTPDLSPLPNTRLQALSVCTCRA